MLKAVLFDMDGVLIDTEPLHRKAYYKMFSDVGINVNDNLYASFTGQSTINICRRLVDHFRLKQSPNELVRMKRENYKYHFYSDSGLALINGVLDLIQDYTANGLKLVVASSASMDGINQIFERFDLNTYFSAKFSGADLKQSKPHPEIFLKAADSTGFSKDHCMVIEDSTNGIKAANAAGIFCVGYRSKHSTGQDYTLANKVVNNFEDIYYEKMKHLI